MLILLILVEAISSVMDCNRVCLSRVKMQDGICCIAGMLFGAYRHNYNSKNLSMHIPKVKSNRVHVKQADATAELLLICFFQEKYFTSKSYSV